MENAVKKTKVMYFTELKDMVMEAEGITDELKDELVDFIDKQVETIEKRKVAAAARAEKKKAEADALTDEIFALMTEDFMTADEIVDILDDETITRNKVTARLAKLIKAEKVVKETIKIDGKRKMAYKLAE